MENEAFAMISYLIAAIFFILALRGLSSPTSSRLGNIFGMVGMSIAIITTLLIGTNLISILIAIPLLSGAFIGIYVAKKVEMTKMPELVALMHSFVGLAAVLIATAAVLNVSEMHTIVQRFELFIGAFIGAITFSASVIAFGKLSGKFGANPSIFNGQHLLNSSISYYYDYCRGDIFSNRILNSILHHAINCFSFRCNADNSNWRC